MELKMKKREVGKKKDDNNLISTIILIFNINNNRLKDSEDGLSLWELFITLSWSSWLEPKVENFWMFEPKKEILRKNKASHCKNVEWECLISTRTFGHLAFHLFWNNSFSLQYSTYIWNWTKARKCWVQKNYLLSIGN